MAYVYNNIVLLNGSLASSTADIDSASNITLVNKRYITDKFLPVNADVSDLDIRVTNLDTRVTTLETNSGGPGSAVDSVAGRTGAITLTSADIIDLPYLQRKTITSSGASSIIVDIIDLSSSADGYLHFFDVSVIGKDTNVVKTSHDTFTFKIRGFIKNVGGVLIITLNEKASYAADLYTIPNATPNYNNYSTLVDYDCDLQISGSSVNIVLTETDNGHTGGGYNSLKVSHVTTIITQN